ncbi:type II secretion system F family protein [Cognatishimia activa]|uniref:Flp pilus assembly protein TadB n=1 Tax=Cognatishimia activa TaxID=1715691 RepID=A0A0P1IVU4_9RHOB|nr:type II secretion system F family protein [Cognatishimia activa]CUJ18142.1 Flp pilus assembly protein TadB [Cognatishimia activa]CUK27588.1 Flp pilus assembly protein TadB [Cognatishimia activa]
MTDNLLMLYGLIFVAALLGVDTLLRILTRSARSRRDVSNRLENIRQNSKGKMEPHIELLRSRGLASRAGEIDISNSASRFLGQTGIRISVPRMAAYLLAFIFLGFVIGRLVVGVTGVFQMVFAIVFGLGLSYGVLWWRRSRRIKAFTNQLPDALDVMVRSLNAGHPLNSSIALVAREMPDPLGSEFGILNDQMTFGAELETAMINLYNRVGASEVNMVTVSVSVQRGTGGNLAEILTNLSQMIRDRLMLKRKILAISAEGRITAWIMLLFPFGLYYMVKFLVPTYFDPLWETGYGPHVVFGCLVGIFMGMIVIRRLVNFDY